MKKVLYVLAVIVLSAALVLPVVALAFSGTFTRTQSISVTDTTGTARTNVPVSLTGINGNTYKTSAYINLTGTNTAVTDNLTGADQTFMMQEGTNSGLIIPSLPPYSTVNVNLLMGTSTNQTGFPIITGTGGYVTTTEAANLKATANFSLSATVDVGHSSNITRKVGEILLADNGTGTITGNVTSSVLTVNQDVVDTYFDESDEVAQLLPSTGSGTFNSASVFIKRTGAPTGSANITVRKASDSSLIGVLGTIADISTVPLVGTWYTGGNPVINAIKQDVMIDFEVYYTGGVPLADFISSAATVSDLTYGNIRARNGFGGAWFDYSGEDETIRYTLTPNNASVVATGVSGGLKQVALVNSNYLLTLSVGGVLQDTTYGANMSSSANDWLWLEGVPYSTSITYSVNGVQQLYYAPTAMIVGTALPDRSADVTNNAGVITWGANSGLTVVYGSVLDAPAIQTLDASGILPTSAYLAGKLTALGSNTDVLVGFEWGLDTTYGSGTTPVIQETAATTYFFQLTGLTPSTTYHYRAFVTAGAQTIYGADKSFATQPVAGSSTTILIRSAKMFSNYIATGDYLLVAEVFNNYTNLYPSQTPREHFTVQLLGINNLTILGASPLTNWGDRPASIYFNPATAGNLTAGSAYFVKMIGDSTANYTSVEYALQPRDWRGSDLTSLDAWNIGTAINMAISDGVAIGTYVAYPTNQAAVINDAAGGFFTTGVPALGQIRPNLFATAQYGSNFTAGTANNAWDKADADPTGWRAFVGTSLATDIDTFAVPFGITGKDFAAAMVMLTMLGCVIFVVGSGGAQALGGLFMSIPILWLGVYARAVPFAAIMVTVIFFSAFAIRQFVVKTL